MTSLPHNPYIGPRTFTASERNLFFGREREASDLLALVTSSRLVLFYAQSGAGKSSLINAMLIPALENEGYKVLAGVRVSGEAPANLEVGNIFVYNLINSLAQYSEIHPEDLKNLSLAKYLAGLGSDENGLVIIIDQFEELFSTHPEAWDQRGDFFKQLSQAMQENRLISIVLVMREDFIAQLDPYTHLLPGGLRTRYYMRQLEREGALQAAKQPVAKLRPFAEGVAERLVNELSVINVRMPDGSLSQSPGQYIEPVQLQVVCYNLWESLLPDGDQITSHDLHEVGDVNRSLETHYARRVAEVAAAKRVGEQAIRQWIQQSLITPSGLRNLVLQETSGQDGGIGDEVIQALQSDLVQSVRRGGATFYELTHDRLVEPILGNNRRWFEANLSPLQRQASLWNQQGRNDSWLLTDEALAEVELWAKEHPDELTSTEREFLEACQKMQAQSEERRSIERRELEMANQLAAERTRSAQRARGMTIIAVILLMIAIILVFLVRAGAIQDTFLNVFLVITSLVIGYTIGRSSRR